MVTLISFNDKTYANEVKADVFNKQIDNKYSYAGHRVKEIILKEIENSELHTGGNPVHLALSNVSIAQFNKIFKNSFVEKPILVK